MAEVTLLRSRTHNLTKSFVRDNGRWEHTEQGFPYLFDVDSAEVNCLSDLSTLLQTLEDDPSAMLIRGRLKEGVQQNQIRRRVLGADSPFERQDCQWICIDIDKLALPEEFSDFNSYQNEIMAHTSQFLPPEFQGVNFHWQFSASMGVKPGIRVHLWYWLDRPVSESQVKAWLSASKIPIDISLYSPVQPHYTASPIFDPPEADPVATRSGIFDFGNEIAAVSVPENLDQIDQERRQAGARRTHRYSAGSKLDPEQIERNDDGKVVDGRDTFMYLKSVDVVQELMSGKPNNLQPLSIDEIAKLTWEKFIDQADNSDGKWTYEDAYEKAGYRLRKLEDGWKPNGRFVTTTLIPDVEPYFELDPLYSEDAIGQLSTQISDFFLSVLENTDGFCRKALRVTMGAGKTTIAMEYLVQVLQKNPNLNVEIYVPRHELIDEVVELLNEAPDSVELIHMKGRGHGHEDGQSLCTRYNYVQSLEAAGLSIRSNACWRNPTEKCTDYETCMYWQQFRQTPGKTGSVRILPHAYLAVERVDTLPNPDIVILDEAILSAIHSKTHIAAGDFAKLLNESSTTQVGDLIVGSLRDGTPLLDLLRENHFDAEFFDSLDVIETVNQLPFDGRTNEQREHGGIKTQRSTRLAQNVCEILSEELTQEDRTQVCRLRYDPGKDEIHANRVKRPELLNETNLLVMDATLDEALTTKLFGEISTTRIDVAQNAFVTQVFDRTGSNMSWNSNEDRFEDLCTFLGEQSAVGDRVLCICHKLMADKLKSSDLPANVAIEHFGNLRGIDRYKEFQTLFITGRNQPSQADVDGIARAVWWDDESPLSHDQAALFGAAPEEDLHKDLRGYLMTDPDIKCGVWVRAFSDFRIEIIHQQIREAETIQAIARLRLVHSTRVKQVYLLGNLPIEFPIDELLAWEELSPDRAEHELIERGDIPLTPTGWLRMRPDLVDSLEQARNLNKRTRAGEPTEFLKVSPFMSRLNCHVASFKTLVDGKPHGRTQRHLFRSRPQQDHVNGATIAVAPVPYSDWQGLLEVGYGDIENSGWGPVQINDWQWLGPYDLFPSEEGE
ncbi:MAG: hypothetical protein GY789_06195 [Hyphomicrobiales bacterium]|nr:hypothetical protein [Hyphomicrobiales bacterium]